MRSEEPNWKKKVNFKSRRRKVEEGDEDEENLRDQEEGK